MEWGIADGIFRDDTSYNSGFFFSGTGGKSGKQESYGWQVWMTMTFVTHKMANDIYLIPALYLIIAT